MKQTALLLVDLQNDFCAGGALAVPRGDETIPVANRLIAAFTGQNAPVIATRDWHPAGHGSFASTHQTTPYTRGELDGLPQTWWPDHCIQHSPGAQLHPLLNGSAVTVTIDKGQDPQIDSYSGFFDNGHRQQTGLSDWLTRHQINHLVVLGLATDYCVKFTVLDALALHYGVDVITDGCRGVNIAPEDSALAFQEMAAAGATLYTLADWLDTHPAC
ncbi:bifunctional nicotinamidase/pyrazinamidase [Shimwellia blattae]|uniref:Nicotinamidase n=1 Tax=Shimwellia blattae (strain ATCC 29907 / DSM 4481 / JCM 1650 / NBRC 105725 / CDC 9005-74) TaxID=630626 RepID=I2BA86_SHIBC|nr:bifunctional nicotinamidase/pyrazinamidase [Shimwellia blattae]AFJ47440.1 nicotinamidase/pyrazinamidase [Shimwellia blattae DSM 4481 = NBRC 105725]GAB80369.1 pyrazinamidase/nicotinamidase [Shimwellia blattae DSM 4481 = NBRC 105725]VDY64937.1 nicotinamidase/pyrazinamidase [Shimwellia blattae]VEC23143.1 nicotinamidase/pyrazinamidase [Shimwellia blattae]